MRAWTRRPSRAKGRSRIAKARLMSPGSARPPALLFLVLLALILALLGLTCRVLFALRVAWRHYERLTAADRSQGSDRGHGAHVLEHDLDVRRGFIGSRAPLGTRAQLVALCKDFRDPGEEGLTFERRRSEGAARVPSDDTEGQINGVAPNPSRMRAPRPTGSLGPWPALACAPSDLLFEGAPPAVLAAVVATALRSIPELHDERLAQAGLHWAHAVRLVRDEDERIAQAKVVLREAPVTLCRAELPALEVDPGGAEHHVDGHDRAAVEVRRIWQRAAWPDEVVLNNARLQPRDVCSGEKAPAALPRVHCHGGLREPGEQVW
mmetsp:Transcript_74133/g.206048  ORF Transcript_74133/g.206048 Transcript_74133/m.206048 type:complete len:322 (-) Transcript_74133:1133-2098(-)